MPPRASSDSPAAATSWAAQPEQRDELSDGTVLLDRALIVNVGGEVPDRAAGVLLPVGGASADEGQQRRHSPRVEDGILQVAVLVCQVGERSGRLLV